MLGNQEEAEGVALPSYKSSWLLSGKIPHQQHRASPRLHLHCSLLPVSMQSDFLSFLGSGFPGTTALKML